MELNLARRIHLRGPNPAQRERGSDERETIDGEGGAYMYPPITLAAPTTAIEAGEALAAIKPDREAEEGMDCLACAVDVRCGHVVVAHNEESCEAMRDDKWGREARKTGCRGCGGKDYGDRAPPNERHGGDDHGAAHPRRHPRRCPEGDDEAEGDGYHLVHLHQLPGSFAARPDRAKAQPGRRSFAALWRLHRPSVLVREEYGCELLRAYELRGRAKLVDRGHRREQFCPRDCIRADDGLHHLKDL